MAFLQTIGDFIVSTWIWNMTFDWFHPVITGLVMFLIIWLIFRRSMIGAVLISFFAQVFVVGILSGAVMLLSDKFNLQYVQPPMQVALSQFNVFYASLWLALVYAVLQSLYFGVGSFIWRYNLKAFLVMVVLGNTIGFILSYMFIQMVRVWYYVA